MARVHFLCEHEILNELTLLYDDLRDESGNIGLVNQHEDVRAAWDKVTCLV